MSLDVLFKCGKDVEVLKEVFINLNNVVGKKVIMEFVGFFCLVFNVVSDFFEVKMLLMKVGVEYIV